MEPLEPLACLAHIRCHVRATEVHEVGPTTTLPACGALWGEPCRAYSRLGNQI
jgi:hypothetical protein